MPMAAAISNVTNVMICFFMFISFLFHAPLRGFGQKIDCMERIGCLNDDCLIANVFEVKRGICARNPEDEMACGVSRFCSPYPSIMKYMNHGML